VNTVHLVSFLIRSGPRSLGEFGSALFRRLIRPRSIKASELFQDTRRHWGKVAYPDKRLWFLTRHQGIVFDVLYLSSYIRHPAIKQVFDNARCVLDLGANVGAFTVMAAAKGKKVIAVEAQIGFIQKMSAILQANKLSDNVVIFQALVGSEEGLFSDRGNIEQASDFGGVMPESTTLDRIVQQVGIRPDFIKIDVEGSEFALVKSPRDWAVMAAAEAVTGEAHFEYGALDELKTPFIREGFHFDFMPYSEKVGIFFAWKGTGTTVGNCGRIIGEFC